ncbi:MAG: 3-phosphoshikimate 1-carboxyvinyltransferase, partial [Chlamydiota bacterium]
MDAYLINPSTLSGSIKIPPSKSQTLRAILFGALGDGISTVENYLDSPDTEAMIHACSLFGAKIKKTCEKLIIDGLNGKIQSVEDVIHAGNSGIVLRFCSAIGSLCSHPVVVTGDHSIRHQRPMEPLIKALSQLGVSIKSMRGDNYAPIVLQGPLKGGQTVLNGQDSQHVSALLIAAAFAKEPIDIFVQDPGEKPWVSLTLDWLTRLNIPYKNHNFDHYSLRGSAHYKGFTYKVPGDISSAAFPIAAALVTRSELIIENIDMNDNQGDKELISIFQKMGASITINEQLKTLHVKKGKDLSGIKVDINSCIDAITILAVVACFAKEPTYITNGAIAKHKECNRIQCITEELRKMGAHIEPTDDGLIINPSSLQGANVHSHGDHRMAMS